MMGYLKTAAVVLVTLVVVKNLPANIKTIFVG